MGAGRPVPITPSKLAAAIQEGFAQLSPARDRFRDAVTEYLGAHTGKGDGIRRPINLIAQACNILISNLLSEEPTHKVRTPLAELRGEAEMLELALDRLWEDTDTLGEVRAAVLDAILSAAGILRLGMRAGKDFIAEEDGRRTPVAEPFIRRIALEDYCCDPAARSQHELRWEAVRYRMSKADAIDSGVFGRDPGEYGPGEVPNPDVATREEAAQILTDLPPMESRSRDADELSGIGRPNLGPDAFRLVETIELWDVFLYIGDRIYTVTVPAAHDPKAVVRNRDKWLLCEPWEGPDPGPMIVFGFCDIPDQPLFKPVVADWRDLHDFCRTVSAKLANEVQNSKVVWGYTGEGEDDAMAVKSKGDSGMVRLSQKGGVEKIEVVGIVKELMPALEWAKQEWADSSGNLPLTGGQSSDATDNTATAAQYLQANAGQRIAEMRDRVEKVLAMIDRHYGWYLTTDPLVKLPLPYRMPGGEMETLHYDAATRRGDFQSYSFSIERYSAIGQDPNVRLKRVGDFLALTRDVFLPLAQEMGASPQAWAGIGKQEYGLENIDELFPAMGQQLQMQAHAAMGGVQPGQPGQPGMGQPALPQQAGMGAPPQPGMPGAGPQMTGPGAVGRGAMAVGVGA